MNRLKLIKLSDFMTIFLLAAIIVVGFIFVGTDTEYNLNQQIARGYISRDAVFFEINNPSYVQHTLITFESDMEGNTLNFYITEGADYYIDDDGSIVKNKDYVEAKDPGFILQNPISDNGTTAIEQLLSGSSSPNYFASLHCGMIRGVYYKGDIDIPPLTSGRFFSTEECLNRNPVAVIGSNYLEYVYESNNKRYIDYLDKKYEVIGITGLSGSSPLDSLIFVNLGSLSPEEQLNGIYYIDSSTNNQAIYDEFFNQSNDLLKCDLKQRSIPLAEIDTISGGMYLKNYLKSIMLGLFLFTFVNILIQNLRRQRSKIAIMKVLGISNLKILFSTTLKNTFEQIIGIIIGIVLITTLILVEYFSLPVNYLIDLSLNLIASACILILIWIFVSEATIILTNPREVIQKI